MFIPVVGIAPSLMGVSTGVGTARILGPECRPEIPVRIGFRQLEQPLLPGQATRDVLGLRIVHLLHEPQLRFRERGLIDPADIDVLPLAKGRDGQGVQSENKGAGALMPAAERDYALDGIQDLRGGDDPAPDQRIRPDRSPCAQRAHGNNGSSHRNPGGSPLKDGLITPYVLALDFKLNELFSIKLHEAPTGCFTTVECHDFASAVRARSAPRLRALRTAQTAPA